MKIVALIPVKGTSERIKSKNVKLFDGEPLFIYTLKKLIKSKIITEVWIDTESQEIVDMISSYGYKCKVLMRDPALATNKVNGNMLFMNALNHIDADIYINIICTAPFLKLESIENGLNILTNGPYDSVIGGKTEKIYMWKNKIPSYDIDNIPNSNTLDDIFIEGMNMYIIRKDDAYKHKRRYGSNPYFYELNNIEMIDINYPSDFEFANRVARSLRIENNDKYNMLKIVMTSEIISDILSGMGLRKYIINDLKLNLLNKKVMGRIKTIGFRKLLENEKDQGLLDALISYEYTYDGDVLFIYNPVDGCACFGGVNGMICRKKRLDGVIIYGDTRDYNELNEIELPVFYKNMVSKDLRNNGIVDTINKPLKINNLTIYPNDLVFGDHDGIVIIPKEFEDEVIERALINIKYETELKLRMVKNIDIHQIMNEKWNF